MDKSKWDGTLLPKLWTTARSHAKGMVIAHLQDQAEPPHWWVDMPIEERRQVTLHLCAVGSVSADLHKRVRNIGGFWARAATRKAQADKPAFVTFPACPKPFRTGGYIDRLTVENIRAGYRSAHPEIAEYWRAQGMLYPKPNGGMRILPSIYTKLRATWLRGNGAKQAPVTMNQGHLKNTVALLNESHVNLVDRMNELLGRMHNHLGNRPDLQAKIEVLFHEFEKLTVDELYPIVKVIASHIEPDEPEMIFDDQDYLDVDNYKF